MGGGGGLRLVASSTTAACPALVREVQDEDGKCLRGRGRHAMTRHHSSDPKMTSTNLSRADDGRPGTRACDAPRRSYSECFTSPRLQGNNRGTALVQDAGA